MQAAFTGCVGLHLNTLRAVPGIKNAAQLHQVCYRQAREKFPLLPASTVQQARDKALAMFRGWQTKVKQRKRASFPKLTRPLPLRLARENIRLFGEDSMMRVTTSEGFLWLPLMIPTHYQEMIRWEYGVSELICFKGTWYVMLTIKTEDVPSLEGPHFGLDLGVANLAVLAGPDIAVFFDGKPRRYVRGKYLRYRQALQEKKKMGMVKKSKGREYRWATNCNHQVSRQIVDLVAAQGGVLHVEKLLGIRDRVKCTRKVNRMIHSWPFAQLLSFIHYKAAMVGVVVVEEDPRHTSQRCSACAHTERGNRPRQSKFKCKQCNYEIHADLNAARNLAAKRASSLGAGGVTPPLSRERVNRKIHRGNCNLSTSTLEAVAL